MYRKIISWIVHELNWPEIECVGVEKVEKEKSRDNGPTSNSTMTLINPQAMQYPYSMWLLRALIINASHHTQTQFSWLELVFMQYLVAITDFTQLWTNDGGLALFGKAY
jgi:hypothetical protein